MWKYILAWLPMLAIAIANGTLRQFVYAPYVSELHAHQISTATGIVLFGIYIWWFLRHWPPASARQAVAIGVIWLALTVAFEFLFMHYVAGHAWDVLLHNYNLRAGRVWPLVLVWIAIAPPLFYRLQK
jgi:hypothetical protein